MNDLVKVTNNELVIRINKIIENPFEIETKELIQLSDDIVSQVKLKSLKRIIDKICMNISSVGDPSWYADAKDIAWDNQKRLTTIYRLLDIYYLIEADIKALKRNKFNCKENDEYLYSFLLRIKELLNLEEEFKNIKRKEITDTIEFYQMLDEINNPQLSKGRELLNEEN